MYYKIEIFISIDKSVQWEIPRFIPRDRRLLIDDTVIDSPTVVGELYEIQYYKRIVRTWTYTWYRRMRLAPIAYRLRQLGTISVDYKSTAMCEKRLPANEAAKII